MKHVERKVVGLDRGVDLAAGGKRRLKVVNAYKMSGGKTVYVPDAPGENALEGGGAYDVMGACNVLLDELWRVDHGPLIVQWPAASGLLIVAGFPASVRRAPTRALVQRLAVKVPLNLPVRLDLYLVEPGCESATRAVYALMDDNYRAFIAHLDTHARLVWRRAPGAPSSGDSLLRGL